MEKAAVEFKPHEYQRIAIDAILANKNIGLFLDMGLGKTVSTLSALDELLNDYFDVKKVLVIAPKLVAQTTWTDEIEKWSHLQGKFKVSKILGTAQQRRDALKDKEANLFLINRENVVWLVEELGAKWFFDCIVIDELSSFKNSSSKRFRALRKVRPLARRVIGLTGTPAPNGLMDLWSEMYLLDKGERLGKTLTSYRDKYFRPGRRNGHIVYDWVLKERADEEIWDAIGDITISMKAVDWLTLPDKQDIIVKVKLDDEEQKRYEKFRKEKVMLPEGFEFTSDSLMPEQLVTADQASTLFIKLLQLASGRVYDDNGGLVYVHNKKIEVLKELVEATQGENILVFYNFQHSKDAILDEFPGARILKSEETIRLFKQGKQKETSKGENIFLAHPLSMGHGLNITEGGNISVWFDLTTSLEAFMQASARLYRQGQARTVYNYILITEKTIEEDVYKLLESKELTQDKLLEAIKERMRGAKDKWV